MPVGSPCRPATRVDGIGADAHPAAGAAAGGGDARKWSKSNAWYPRQPLPWQPSRDRRVPMPHSAFSPDAVAVVTGGASGIGLAAAVRFARMGLRVCIADLGEDRVAGAADALAAAAPR